MLLRYLHLRALPTRSHLRKLINNRQNINKKCPTPKTLQLGSS